MKNYEIPWVTLNNGVKMPQIGLGVMLVEEGKQMESTISTALEAGYRLFDNAALYGNEAGVGSAIKASGIKREEVFISTKLRNSMQAYDDALKAFELSLKTLDLDYIDLYLIHWPVPAYNKYTEAWKALEKLYKDGLIRAIGVSNFLEHHLKKILEMCEIKPAVNQLECNPYLTIAPLRQFCHNHDIWPEAWFPLGGPRIPAKGDPPSRILVDDPTMIEIGDKYGKSAAQIALRWEIQSNIITIPKSSNPGRIKENIDIFDFNISDEDMRTISALNFDRRVGPHPDTLNELF